MAPRTEMLGLISDPNRDRITKHFLRRFPQFIRVDLHSTYYNDEEPHRFLNHVSESLEELCHSCVDDIEGIVISFWTAPFTFSIEESRSAQGLNQDRCTLLAGVRPTEHGQTDLLDDEVDAIRNRVSGWKESIEASDVYKDERYPPSLFAVVTPSEYVQGLIVDNIICPELVTLSPTIIRNVSTQEIEDEEEPQDYVEEKDNDVSPERRVKLRPASDILKRLRWDHAFNSSDFTVIYEDRFTAFKEVPITSFAKDSTDESFVPEHRIAAFRNSRTGQVVWHKERRLDLISGS